MTFTATRADMAAALPPHLLRFRKILCAQATIVPDARLRLPLSRWGFLSPQQGWPCYAAWAGECPTTGQCRSRERSLLVTMMTVPAQTMRERRCSQLADLLDDADAKPRAAVLPAACTHQVEAMLTVAQPNRWSVRLSGAHSG